MFKRQMWTDGGGWCLDDEWRPRRLGCYDGGGGGGGGGSDGGTGGASDGSGDGTGDGTGGAWGGPGDAVGFAGVGGLDAGTGWAGAAPSGDTSGGLGGGFAGMGGIGDATGWGGTTGFGGYDAGFGTGFSGGPGGWSGGWGMSAPGDQTAGIAGPGAPGLGGTSWGSDTFSPGPGAEPWAAGMDMASQMGINDIGTNVPGGMWGAPGLGVANTGGPWGGTLGFSADPTTMGWMGAGPDPSLGNFGYQGNVGGPFGTTLSGGPQWGGFDPGAMPTNATPTIGLDANPFVVGTSPIGNLSAPFGSGWDIGGQNPPGLGWGMDFGSLFGVGTNPNQMGWASPGPNFADTFAQTQAMQNAQMANNPALDIGMENFANQLATPTTQTGFNPATDPNNFTGFNPTAFSPTSQLGVSPPGQPGYVGSNFGGMQAPGVAPGWFGGFGTLGNVATTGLFGENPLATPQTAYNPATDPNNFTFSPTPNQQVSQLSVEPAFPTQNIPGPPTTMSNEQIAQEFNNTALQNALMAQNNPALLSALTGGQPQTAFSSPLASQSLDALGGQFGRAGGLQSLAQAMSEKGDQPMSQQTLGEIFSPASRNAGLDQLSLAMQEQARQAQEQQQPAPPSPTPNQPAPFENQPVFTQPTQTPSFPSPQQTFAQPSRGFDLSNLTFQGLGNLFSFPGVNPIAFANGTNLGLVGGGIGNFPQFPPPTNFPTGFGVPSMGFGLP